MAPPDHVYQIPAERLPPGFAQRIEAPPEPPAEPRPAATAVLLRDGAAGPEILLMKRHRQAGFVPGAYVFPGGRVDDADADPRLLAFAPALAGAVEPPAPYWFGAAREIFEETGVLLASGPSGRPAADAAHDPALEALRERLMSGGATLLDVLDAAELRLDLRRMVYCAHWITPVVEPRRYDTRFFLAELPEGREATADPREMTDAVWLTATDALDRFRANRLPMVFPTVKMLEALAGFPSAGAALEAFRGRPVSAILPRLVRTPRGVAITLD